MSYRITYAVSREEVITEVVEAGNMADAYLKLLGVLNDEGLSLDKLEAFSVLHQQEARDAQ